MFKVYIDPGHGGEDPGAVGSFYKEKSLNIDIADLFSMYCIRNGWDTRWSRYEDINVRERDTADDANNWNAQVFVSIHVNSHTEPIAEGHEVLYWHSSEMGKNLAQSVSDELKSILTGRQSRGIKPKRPGDRGQTVLQKTRMPAIIVECGFISNPHEEIWLSQFRNQAAIAEAIVEGIQKTELYNT
jgi:N-acetylmuramoyl-L-alanine amidase